MWSYTQMIKWFENQKELHLLLKGDWGIEREGQRITETGDLALTDHPAAFGNKLTNPNITTDFAESQLELITPPLCSVEEVHAKLVEIHDEVLSVLDRRKERLWPLSMPPRLPSEEQIRIAQYDDTPEGRASEAYRQGLAERYGKKMQMISGLHVNFSFQQELIAFLATKMERNSTRDLSDELYFAMARNFLRYRWLLIYLFGASPTIDQSYDSVLGSELDAIEQCSQACCPTVGQYEKYATSLRVSRYGYANANQRDIYISFDSIEAQIAGFKHLLETTIDNEREFYSSIRMKPLLVKGERYLESLEKHGVRYAEIRLLDLNPFVREGISLQQLRFIHVFMIWCLFEQSPAITAEQHAIIHENHHMVSLFGRKPGLKLEHYETGKVKMTTWMEEIFIKLKRIAVLLDSLDTKSEYQRAIEDEYVKINNTALIPSARMVEEMTNNHYSFLQYGVCLAEMNQKINAVGSASC